jgi:hypothetical protein
MVQKIINNIFIDGQLDECELTLKNLHEIARSFNRILIGIFHHRVDYPEPVHKSGSAQRKSPGNEPKASVEQLKPANGGKTRGDTAEQSPETPSDRDQPAKKGGSEDLKRLGMS